MNWVYTVAIAALSGYLMIVTNQVGKANNRIAKLEKQVAEYDITLGEKIQEAKEKMEVAAFQTCNSALQYSFKVEERLDGMQSWLSTRDRQFLDDMRELRKTVKRGK